MHFVRLSKCICAAFDPVIDDVPLMCSQSMITFIEN